MPDRTTQTAIDRFETLLTLIEQDGASAPGELPADYVRELREMDDIDRGFLDELETRHANNEAPPAWAGGKP